MDITLIEGQTLPDVWFQAIYNLIKNGRRFIVNKGSYEGEDRIEYDYFVGHIKRPWERDADGRPLVPEMPEGISIPPPVDKEYIFSYWKKLMTVEKETGEDYTYGERLVGSPNQIDKIIDTYKEFGYRNNQMILQVGQPSDIELGDPPCVVKDTLILTSNGYKLASTIKVGDLVLTHNGRFKKVTQCFKRPFSGKLTKISGGIKDLYITPEHSVYVTIVDKCYDNKMVCKPACKKQFSSYEKNGRTCKKSYNKYHQEWVEAGKLQPEMYGTFPNIQNYHQLRSFSKKEMWLFGIFIADGDYTKKDGIRFNLGSHESKIINRCIEYMKSEYNLDPHIQLSNDNNSCTRISFYSRELYVKFYNMFGEYAAYKIVPFEFIFEAADNLDMFINGCIAGGGYRRKDNNRRVGYYTSSFNVRVMMELLLNKLGHIPSITKVKVKDSVIDGRVIKSNYDGYAFSWTLGKNKNKGSWFDNNYRYSSIKRTNVPLNVNCNVYNFEVEDDNSYIADGVVVHNCLRHIDSRIQDNKLHFFPYFRSWDLWGGFPANLAGISLLQEYMAAEIGIEQGEMIVSSKGLHIYGYALELAETITHNEFKNDS